MYVFDVILAFIDPQSPNGFGRGNEVSKAAHLFTLFPAAYVLDYRLFPSIFAKLKAILTDIFFLYSIFFTKIKKIPT